MPPAPEPMDFSAWYEVFLGERWYIFDARHHVPRIGRILMARGRDATDVAISTSFGPCQLTGFKVLTDEVRTQVAGTEPEAKLIERHGPPCSDAVANGVSAYFVR